MKKLFLTLFLYLFLQSLAFHVVAENIKHNTVADYLQQAKIKARQEGIKANNLLGESSPYLLQHAYNPVEWHAWGETAFEKARKENKPIFLSIGYSTCHWCHVMAHESFENKEIAALLNKHFICIKVDREQRPDVDSVYMSATQLISGSGGWPMTVFLDHKLRPFHAATYYPPYSIGQRKGLKEVILKIDELWRNDQVLLDQVATSVTAKIKSFADDAAGQGKLDKAELDKGVHDLAMQQIMNSYDSESGGFSAAPKFPRPGIFSYLNGVSALTGEHNENRAKAAKLMMKTTLDAMASGGIYDQISGGFHRYSVDENWQVPHFEKMLYSQALMVIAYSELYKVDPQQKYKKIVYQTLKFAMDEMRLSAGGFFSALDADSEQVDATGKKTGVHSEGAYYLWSENELKAALSKTEFEFIRNYFHVRENGNIYSDSQDEFTNLNILYVDEEFKDGQVSAKQEKLLDSVSIKLNEIRYARPRPHLDDKVITAWNGMMITALAAASVVFDNPVLLAEAIKTSRFILNNSFDKKNKKLHRQYRGKKADIDAALSDYVWLIHGLLEIFQSNKDEHWLKLAIKFHDKQNELFLAQASAMSSGGYFESSAGDENLLFRSKNIYDGALPSANAIALANLRKLSELSSDGAQRASYSMQADKLVASFATVINQNPAAASTLLSIELNRVKLK